MILIIETMDDAQGALLALRDWTQQAPELKTGARYGARRRRAEDLQEQIVTTLRTFRRLRLLINKTSDEHPASPDEVSRDNRRARDAGRRPSGPPNGRRPLIHDRDAS